MDLKKLHKLLSEYKFSVNREKDTQVEIEQVLTECKVSYGREYFLDGETDLMIISLRSGIGLDGLQGRCSYVVVGELDWSPKVHHQLVGRIDRDGQQEQVTAMYMVSNFGSDPVMVDILAIKSDQAQGIENPMAGVEKVYTDTTYIKKLANDYLAKRGIQVPKKEDAKELFTET